jgi:pimeloyl-ACP methyl ester carboxylesterase
MIVQRSIAGRQLACWVGGSFLPGRRTLVFIHGSGGDHTNWVRQYTAFKNASNIAAIDLPGHGRSEGPGERDVAPYVEWVRRTLDSFGIVRPVLIGHSLGAAIVLDFAVRFGKDAAAVVAVGGGAKLPVNAVILEALAQDPASVIALAGRWAVAKANRERLSGLLTERLSRVDPVTLLGDFVACDRMELSGAVAGIRIPTLAICGAEDKMTPPALSQDLGGRIPGAQVALIAGAGHFVMLEEPAAFNAALTAFIGALP